MNIFLWILQGVLAIAFLMAGAMKLLTPKISLEKKMAWAEPLQPWMIKSLGGAEILGAAGLILPSATRIAPVLTPVAACGLLLIMAGAVTIHARRHEASGVYTTVALGVCSALVAWARFGPFRL